MLRRAVRFLLVAASSCLSSPVFAQVGASVSVATDDIFRGHSLSEGRPIATASVSYDDPSGLYAGGSATGVDTAESGIQLLGVQGYAGYARRIGTGTTIDTGVTHVRYSRYFSGNASADYTEFYIGLITNHISSHVRYSPDYFRKGVSTIYGDVDGVIQSFTGWRLNGHAGVLVQADGPHEPGVARTRYDWRIGVSRQLGPLDLQLAWAGGGPGRDYYADRPRGHSTVVLGASIIF